MIRSGQQRDQEAVHYKESDSEPRSHPTCHKGLTIAHIVVMLSEVGRINGKLWILRPAHVRDSICEQRITSFCIAIRGDH